MYITTISATFEEYIVDTTYVSANTDDAKKFVFEIMSDIEENTSCEREKNFAKFLKNNILANELHAGFGNMNHVAYDIVEQAEYSARKEKEQTKIERKIERLSKEIEEKKVELSTLATKLGNIE